MIDREKLIQYKAYLVQGFKDMFELDEFKLSGPKNNRKVEIIPSKPYRTCRECEFIATAFSFGLTARFYYLTRMGRIKLQWGLLLGLASSAWGVAIILNRRPYKEQEITIYDVFKPPQSHTIENATEKKD